MNILEGENLKRYYTIGEVAELLDVSKSLIRFWESEFEFLKPHKNSKGDRRFTQENIDQLKSIYHLVKEKGFTLEGAKNALKENKKRDKEKQQVIEKLLSIKEYLKEIRDQI